MNPAQRSVRPNDAVDLVIVATSLFGRGGIQNALPIFRVNGFKPGARRLIETVARAAPNFFVARANVEHRILVWIGEPEDLPDVLDHLAKPLLARPQRLLGLLALGTVTNHR